MSIAIYTADPKGCGARIRKAREDAGEPAAKVAADLRISEFRLGKIERGEVKRASHDLAAAIDSLFARYRLGGDKPATRGDAFKAHPDLRDHLRRQEEILRMIPDLQERIADLEARLAAAVALDPVELARVQFGPKAAADVARALAALRGRGKGKSE